MPVDPTTLRLSDHFLLSDAIGCHSVYTKGYANVWDDPDGSKLREGRCLAETVLEDLVAKSPLSICYGYISLELARKIVTYQSPEKPSYHQWNDGAAVDVKWHNFVADDPSLVGAVYCDRNLPMSRTITYAESDFMCLGTRHIEVTADKPRLAFYENRYIEGQGKPQYINYPYSARRVAMQDASIDLVRQTKWWGHGYPTYHGGGIRALEHINTSKYTVYGDFMYARDAVHNGYANALTPTSKNIARVRQLGAIYDELLDVLEVNRLSIVRAYESPRWSDDILHTWTDAGVLTLVPPAGSKVLASDIADAARDMGATIFGAANKKKRATIGFAWKPMPRVVHVHP